MTVQSTDSPGHSPATWVEDEIDLRQYLLVLVAWWREILLVTLLAGIAALLVVFALRYTQETRYEASANVIMTTITSQVRLDERVQTTIDPRMGGTSNEWRNSLLALLKDGAVVQAVIDEIGDQLPPSLRNPADLAEVIKGELPESGMGNVIQLSATTRDPALSALIANTWTQKYSAHINQLYGDVPDTTVETVRAELNNAQADFEAAQQALETFIASNRLDELHREINRKVALHDNLVLASTQAITTVIASQNEAMTAAYIYLAKRPVNVTIQELTAQEASAVEEMHNLRRRQAVTQIQLERARNLERQLVEAGDAAAQTTARPLQLLKDQIFASGPFESVGLVPPTIMMVESPTSSIDAETQLADVRSLIQVLEAYSEELSQQMEATTAWQMIQDSSANVTQALAASATLSPTVEALAEEAAAGNYETALADAFSALLAPNEVSAQLAAAQNSIDSTQQLIVDLESEIQSLRAALAAEQSRRRQLVQERDLAWDTYDTLSNKLMELSLLRTATNSLLRPAGPALVPTEPVPPVSFLLPVAAATMAGFLAMVLFAFLANSLGTQPFLARRSS